jgi:hypothetical protein
MNLVMPKSSSFQVDMTKFYYELSFNIITKALFGFDILESNQDHEYTDW